MIFAIQTAESCLDSIKELILDYVVGSVQYLRQTAIILDCHMLGDSPTTDPDSESDEDLDDPYVHLVSTEEFVETAEKGSQEHEE